MSKANSLIEVKQNNNNIDVNLDLSEIRKKRISINGDENKVLELNTSDMGVIIRLNEIEPKLQSLSNKANEISAMAELDIDDTENFGNFATKLKEIDNEMRNLMDDLFQANVSEVCCEDGSMFDPFDGAPRFQIILNALVQLYDESVKKEMQKDNTNSLSRKRVHYHTDKYTGR